MPEECTTTDCKNCELYRRDLSCGQERLLWLMKDCKEPEIEIDWEKVPVDTPVYARDYITGKWRPRYFKCFMPNNDNSFRTFCDGRNSFTISELANTANKFIDWKLCKLAREEDIEKYRKR